MARTALYCQNCRSTTAGTLIVRCKNCDKLYCEECVPANCQSCRASPRDGEPWFYSESIIVPASPGSESYPRRED